MACFVSSLYGGCFRLIKYFPELVMPLSEWFQSFFPEELPEILQESIIMN